MRNLNLKHIYKKIWKIILASIISLWISAVSLAAFDLEITNISLSNLGDTVALNSNPSIDITIQNNWPDIAQNSNNIAEWFINCIENASQNTIFSSSTMSTFIVNPDTNMIAKNLSLKDTLTMTQRTVNITCSVNKNGSHNWYFSSSESNYENNSKWFSFNVDQLWRFDSSIDRAIDPIRDHLDAAEPWSTLWGWDSIKNFIFNKIINIVTPIIIVVGILMWILWAYRLLFSSSSEETTKWIQLVAYWVIWIIIILSARYIWTVIFQDLFQSWNPTAINGVELSMMLYQKIAYPFIKIAVYLALWALFLVLAWKTFSFITSWDWSAQKKAWTIIAWSTIAMLIIIGSKQIVEAIYGKQAQVMNESAQTLWEIWTWILADKNIPILYSVINRVMWLTSLVVLIIILIQTFEILMNPDKADNRQRIWKSILYIFIWILIIWAGYLITNFVVIN